MKNYILPLLLVFFCILSVYGQNNIKLDVGMKVTEWKFKDADGKEFTMNSWPGKVLQINYVDPDESDLNDTYNDAIDKAIDVDKRISRESFKGFGIVDCKSTWKPNMLIRSIAGNKAKKYNTTILFDYDAALQDLWGLPSDSYSVIILDKNRICRALYPGKIPDTEIENVIKLIVKLSGE